MGVPLIVLQREKSTQARTGRHVAGKDRSTAAQHHHGHSPVVHAALLNGGKEAGDVLLRLPLDQLLCFTRQAGCGSTHYTFDLRIGQGQTEGSAELFGDLIQAANHPQLQAPAGGGIGHLIVHLHQVHCPATDVRYNHRGLLQQLRLPDHSGIALGE